MLPFTKILTILSAADPARRAVARVFTYKGQFVLFAAIILLFMFPALAQQSFEGRRIEDVSIQLERRDSDPAAAEPFLLIAERTVGEYFSSVRIRDAIAGIYDTKLVEFVEVSAGVSSGGGVDLVFKVRQKIVAKRVSIIITDTLENSLTESELLLRLNLLDPGTTIDQSLLQQNADLIVEYLRERGFYRAEARFEQQPVQIGNEVEAAVTFRVTAGPQAKVNEFQINISGAEAEKLRRGLKLSPGAGFSREQLTADLERVRENLQKEGFLAPTLEEPRIIYDSETDLVDLRLTGNAGPTVEVVVEAERDRVGQSTQRRLLPIKRDGTLDYAAIIEGERRLENHYQERGYFFVDVTAVCSVDPPLEESDAVIPNDTAYVCSALTSNDLAGKNVTVTYQADLNRRLKLVDIRLRGVSQFTADDIKSALGSQEANILGIIPLFGYGRGYTSQRILDEDAATIRSLLRELGYRDAEVRVNQGVSLDGESLIITFVVEEGPATIVSDVMIEGNTAFSDAVLMSKLPNLRGTNFSMARVRNGQRALSDFYSNEGYFDANVTYSIDRSGAASESESPRFKVIYNVQNEGRPVRIGDVHIAGNVKTKEKAIRRTLNFRHDALLTSGGVYRGEQNLYSTDAFERVSIRTRPAEDKPDGDKVYDLLVEVEEQKPRLLQWGGGFSTDLGLSGFVDIRHLNLFGSLWQGGSRIRWSQRQQIVGIDFVDPRFMRDGEDRFAPLTISAQYQRDSTVTRFFRSAFDRGTFGIVQRLDEEGNPVDEFGAPADDPTLDRLTFSAETNKTISLKDRSILFFKYRFEHVRLANIQSLLIKELLEPDDRVRISGFGATFVRDTRRRCGIEYSILDIIARGEPGEPCRYNASDPTDGDYLTAEYNVSVPALGANIGFHKFQASYNYYYTFPKLKNTTIAARGILGLASVFSRPNVPASSLLPDIEKTLPISERFFAGGGNTLRGFEFESAGPRVVIDPQGTFHNSDGEPVTLDPFTIPLGGNALAIVNIEARVPVTNSVRMVGFYDGGNVFRRVGDLFKPASVPDSDIIRRNLNAKWTHTVGIGLRLKTPIGGEFGIDYGYLLKPPTFLIPQDIGPPATIRLKQGQLHFRFSQAF